MVKIFKLNNYNTKSLKIGGDNMIPISKYYKEYIIKEAEMLIKSYTEELEKKSPKWKNNMKKLEKRYKNSIRLNIFLVFTTILGIIFNLI